MNKLMKRIALLTLILCVTLASGLLAACGKTAYTVTTDFDASCGNVTLSAPDADGKWSEGSTVTVTVAPLSGYEVDAFTVNGSSADLTDGKYTFTVKKDTTVKVTFKQTGDAAEMYAVTLVKSFTEAMGTADLSPAAEGGKYAKGTLVTLTVTVNSGYELLSIVVGDETVELDQGKYTFSVKADTQITVTMQQIGHFGVTLNYEEDQGSVKLTPAADADGKYTAGTAVTLTVTPASGYVLSSVTVDGTPVELDEENSYTFTVNKDITCSVVFEKVVEYSITITGEHCDLVYATKVDGQAQNVKIESGDTFAKDSKLTITAVSRDGYKVTAIAVDDAEVDLDEGSFTLTMDGDKTITITTVWDVEKKTSFVGEYDVTFEGEASGQIKWYCFTLEKETVYNIAAVNYTVYMVFFHCDAEPTAPVTGKPDYIFNPDGNIKEEAHTFEAGIWAVRLDGGSEDGAGAASRKQFTVTEIKTLGFTFMQPFQGSWKSTDDKYTMNIGTNTFALTAEGKEVTATVTEGDSSYNVAFDGKTYTLMPYGALGVLALTDQSSAGEPILFLPDPLPSIAAPKELVGVYEDSMEASDKLLTITASTFTWGEDKVVLLAELTLGGDGMPVFASVNGKLYLIMAMQTGVGSDQTTPTYGIMLSTPDQEETYMYVLKAEQSGVTIDPSFYGKWKCQVATSPLNGYTLEISADGIVVTDPSGAQVQTTVGTYTRYSRDYVSFTVNGATYYLSVARGGTLTVISVSDSKSISFVKVTT